MAADTDYSGLAAAGAEIIAGVTAEGRVFPAATAAQLRGAAAALVQWPYGGDGEERRRVIRLNAAGFSVPERHRYRVLGQVLALAVGQDGPRVVLTYGHPRPQGAGV